MTIARLQFIKSVKSSVAAKSFVHLDIIVSSEFNDPIKSVSSLASPNFVVKLFVPPSSTRSLKSECSIFDIEVVKCGVRNDMYSLKLMMPDVIGYACLKIELLNADGEDEIVIIPIISGWFMLFCKEDGESSSFVMPVLNCYREFNLSGGSRLFLKEDYGATLGSHIYDSSIVLLQFIESKSGIQVLGDVTTKKMKIIEVGAGCGLIGIYFASLEHRVLLTDKKEQLALLRENIAENDVQSNCAAVEFNWESAEQFMQVKNDMENHIDIIIAGDVLYDRKTAAMFFDTAQKLSIATSSKVLLAQKIRQNNVDGITSKVALIDVSKESGFRIVEKIHEKSDVILWMLTV